MFFYLNLWIDGYLRIIFGKPTPVLHKILFTCIRNSIFLNRSIPPTLRWIKRGGTHEWWIKFPDLLPDTLLSFPPLPSLSVVSSPILIFLFSVMQWFFIFSIILMTILSIPPQIIYFSPFLFFIFQFLKKMNILRQNIIFYHLLFYLKIWNINVTSSILVSTPSTLIPILFSHSSSWIFKKMNNSYNEIFWYLLYTKAQII